MMFPLDFWDISLLIAVLSVILLITSELISINLGKINILINKKKLKNSAIAASMLFLVTFILRIAGVILNF